MNERGEHKFKLGSVEFTLVMNYKRIMEIEEEVGIGVISLAGRFSHLMTLQESENPARDLMISPVRLIDVARCLSILTGNAQSTEAFGDMVLKVGLVKAIEPLSEFFGEAIAGAPMGESQAGEQESKTDDSL